MWPKRRQSDYTLFPLPLKEDEVPDIPQTNAPYVPPSERDLQQWDRPYPRLEDSTDAMRWAQAFCSTYRERCGNLPPDRRADLVDEGWLVGWFANAMAAQERSGKNDGCSCPPGMTYHAINCPVSNSVNESGDEDPGSVEYSAGFTAGRDSVQREVEIMGEETSMADVDSYEDSSSPPPAIHLVIRYNDGRTGFFPVPYDQGWKIDPASRCLIVGHGVPRTMIPLDGVDAFDIEECHSHEH